MTHSVVLTRRQALLGAAALPLAGGALGLFAGRAHAAADMMGPTPSLFSRFKLGEMEVTTLLAGTRTVADPNGIFGLNATPEEFAAASAAAFIPTDKAQFFFTPTLVNTGKELVLFDTGTDPGGITAALGAAGYTPDQVDIVVLTHMHGDHIGGLMKDGAPTFANARYVTGSAEHNHWSAAANEGFDANVKPLNEKMTFLDDSGSVVSGISAILAPGHTPGHMGYRVESGGQGLVLIADTANHYIWSLAHPTWEVKFDADKTKAAETRRNILGMIASDKLPFIGYHMPFPALGYIESANDGFRYVPASYQLLMTDPA